MRPYARHYVTVKHGEESGGRAFCRAFCHSCFWQGPKVRFAHTADRHGRKHIQAMEAAA